MRFQPRFSAEPSACYFSINCDEIPNRNNLKKGFTLVCSFLVVSVVHHGGKVQGKGSDHGDGRTVEPKWLLTGHCPEGRGSRPKPEVGRALDCWPLVAYFYQSDPTFLNTL